MDCTISPFGKIGNDKVWLYTLVTSSGLEISITNYGAIVTAINLIRGRKHFHLAYGYQNLSPYLSSTLHAGGIIGRYANRIKGAAFDIGGEHFKLTPNELGNNLHGGELGFDKQIWEPQFFEITGGVCTIRFYLRSADMEEGFPGNLDVWVTYQITDDNQICVNYLAKTDSPTHVNLTTHGYFNLNGFSSNVNDLLLQIEADNYLPVDAQKIPLGSVAKVDKTAYDFRNMVSIGKNLQKLGSSEFDCCFVLNNPRLSKPSITLRNTKNGLSMKIYTNQPALQLYTPALIPADSQIQLPETGCWAVCLEPQHYPNTPNMPQFPSTLLLPEDEYNQTVIYSFNVND